jgi:hypothetical protein
VAAFPPTGFTSAVTNPGGNQYNQTLTGYPFGGAGAYTSNCSSWAPDQNTPRPWKAFDYETGTWWENNYGVSPGYNAIGATATSNAYSGSYTTTVSGSSIGGEWLQLGLPTAIVLYSYSMYNRAFFNGSRMPYQWVVAGSNDGTTWTTVDVETGITWTSATQTFTTTSTTPYLYFRMIVQAIQTGGQTNQPVNIGQWTLNGSNVSWNTDFYADRLGNLLTAPVTGQRLAKWLGGATGYVTTWYDQSGRGNDAIQNTAANQPIIQKATKGAGYSCLFNGTTNYINFGSSTILNGTNYSVCGVTRRNISGGNRYYIGSAGTNLQYQQLSVGYYTDTSTILNEGAYALNFAVPAYAGASEPVTYENWSMSQTTGIYNFSWRAGTTYNNGNNGLRTPLSSAGNGVIGAVGTNGSYSGYFSGEMFELLIFTASLFDLSSSVSGQLTPIPSIIQSIYNNQLSYTGV